MFKFILCLIIFIIPYSLKADSLSAVLHIDEDANHFANVTLDCEISKFIELFKGRAPNLSGRANVDVNLMDAEIRGVTTLKKGIFEIPETGALYKNIEADFDIENSTAYLKDLSATDAFDGIIKGSGQAELNFDKSFPFVLDLQVENTRLLRLDYATATGNGLLKLTGDLNGALLSGKVVAEEARVEIPEESKILVQSLDVVYINQNKDETPPTVIQEKVTSWPISLDLDFEVKKPFSIRGKDLKSHWTGALKIKGTSYKPEIFGEFKLLDGQYKFRGKIFEISEGTITFSGNPAKKTTLYVIGSQEIGDLRVDVILKGPLSSPAISFRSNPPLPQREILSRILFGSSSKELNAFQGSELNQSIKDLSAGSAGADLLTKIRNKIGIDTIDISQNKEEDDISIKVGKYISKGVLVSVNKSMSSDANRLEIEAKLFKDLKLQAEIGDNKEGQLNLKWRTDY